MPEGSCPPRRRTLRRAADLIARGLARPEDAAALEQVAQRFAIAVTPDLAEAMQGPGDPLARQFVPHPEELVTLPEEISDPIGDEAFSPLKGLVHRYPDRVLLKPLLMCPVYCRFCFRREKVGKDGGVLSWAELDAACAYIRSKPEIWEVILSGGDPLMLPPQRLGRLFASLTGIDHVQVIRIHSRVPVVDPGRIGETLLKVLRCGKTVYVVVHANHPGEFSDSARAALARLSEAGIPLLGQTVLLKGVNADAATLEALFRAMVSNRIKPYYLHHGDLARGTGHFRTTIAEGRDLMRTLRGRVSGLCQPTYVLDIPGGHGKVPVGPCYLHGEEVEDPGGRRHPYPPR